LNTPCIATIDDVNEGKGIWQIINDNVVHNLRFPNARAVNNYNSILKNEMKYFVSVEAKPITCNLIVLLCAI